MEDYQRKDWEREIYKKCDEEDEALLNDVEREMEIDPLLYGEDIGDK
jgi:hypothetical protein